VKNTLETAGLILRPLTLDDFSAVHSWGGNPENTRYMMWDPNSEEQTRVFLSSVVKDGKDFCGCAEKLKRCYRQLRNLSR
jgi:RimJ/RimL family protein N-acetyltransferase